MFPPLAMPTPLLYLTYTFPSSLQESYFTFDSTQPSSLVDHDVHFRPGIGARGEETFTPRTLIYDLKGGFGGLRKWGGLYDQQISGDGVAEEGRGVW